MAVCFEISFSEGERTARNHQSAYRELFEIPALSSLAG